MPRHRLFITHLTSTSRNLYTGAQSAVAVSAATADCRFAPSPERKREVWIWPAAFLLHAAMIALALISFRRPPPMQASQPGVSVVFDSGGTRQNTAPPAQTAGPAAPAVVPPPAAPPPPVEAQAQQPEVNLNLPPEPLAQMALPPPRLQSAERHVQSNRATPRHQYQVMNNMSLGNASPPMPNAKHGLNLQLSQSDLNAMNRPEISVQGEIGQDWMDGFNKWVNDHTYYPQEASEEGEEGTSTIEFTVHRDGSITGLHLLDSAGSPFLDQAWLGIFAQNNVPPFPAGTRSDTIKITASLHYQIIR